MLGSWNLLYNMYSHDATSCCFSLLHWYLQLTCPLATYTIPPNCSSRFAYIRASVCFKQKCLSDHQTASNTSPPTPPNLSDVGIRGVFSKFSEIDNLTPIHWVQEACRISTSLKPFFVFPQRTNIRYISGVQPSTTSWLSLKRDCLKVDAVISTLWWLCEGFFTLKIGFTFRRGVGQPGLFNAHWAIKLVLLLQHLLLAVWMRYWKTQNVFRQLSLES